MSGPSGTRAPDNRCSRFVLLPVADGGDCAGSLAGNGKLSQIRLKKRADNITFATNDPVRHGLMGLGLSICYRIAQDHLGSLEVDSEVGRGTTMTVRIPADLGERLSESPAAG